MNLLKKLFGDYSQKEIKRIQPLCDQVLALEETYRAMSEKELKHAIRLTHFRGTVCPEFKA